MSRRRQDNNVSASELADLRDAFQLFDTDKTGTIIVRDLLESLQDLQGDDDRPNTKTSHRLQQGLRQQFAADDALSLDDFIHLFTAPNPSDTRDEFSKVFDLFDENRKGYITADDLRNVANQLGEESLDDEDLNTMIRFVANNGKVTIEQFSDIMQKKL